MQAMLLRGRRAAAAAAVRKLLQLLKELVSQLWPPQDSDTASAEHVQ